MLEHYRCLYEWYQDIFRSYPDLVIENCGSGAQRMDYGMLSLLSLQSTSDQTDYILNSFIAANVASAVTPEQAGMWVYPYVDEREHIIYNMVNGMLLRPYISGLVWTISEEGLNLFREGIDVYKSIRDTEKDALPFFPLGFTNSKASVLAYGLQKENIAYLSVFMPDADKADIPLKFEGKEIKAVSVLYPGSGDCKFAYEDGALKVVMPQKKCARFFKIDLM
jgi:alpha-galactosidase